MRGEMGEKVESAEKVDRSESGASRKFGVKSGQKVIVQIVHCTIYMRIHTRGLACTMYNVLYTMYINSNMNNMSMKMKMSMLDCK